MTRGLRLFVFSCFRGYRATVPAASLMTQRGHRIDRHGAPCRHQHRYERDRGEETGHRQVRPPVGWRDAEEHRLERPPDRPGEAEAGDQRREQERANLMENQPPTSARRAPSATRMPISRVRCAHEYEITP